MSKELPSRFSDDLNEQVERYLAGMCLPDEIAKLEIWFHESTPGSAGLRALKDYVDSRINIPAITTDGAWDYLSNQLTAIQSRSSVESTVQDNIGGLSNGVGSLAHNAYDQSSASAKKTGRFAGGGPQGSGLLSRTLGTVMGKDGGYSRIALPRWAGYAAVAGLLILGLKYLPSNQVIPQLRTYSTTTAQRAKLNLPDGSSVLLAPESEITYAPSFGSKDRVIHLRGQALFTVVKDGHPPFIVNAGNTSTRVLGTTFDIRAYDANIRVAVAEGKVSVASHTLSLGDVANISSTGVDVKHNIPVNDLLGWTAGRLVFRETPLKEVLADFRRMYGVDVELSNPAIGNRLVTVSISDMTSQGAVDMLATMFALRVTQRGEKILLTE